MKNRYRLYSQKKPFITESDKNDRFVKRTCLVYLERLISCYSMLNKEFMEMLFWVLGQNFEEIGEFLLKNIKGGKQLELQEDLYDCQGDHEEYGNTIVQFLNSPPKGIKSKFTHFLSMFLRRKIRDLDYKGNSDIEKNVLTLKKMFNLTDQETEFCFFLFIVTAYNPAEIFFVDSLECQKPSGRKYVSAALSISHNELNDILRGTLAKIEFFDWDNICILLEQDYLNFIINPSVKTFSKDFFTPITGNNSIPLEYHFIKREQTAYILGLLKHKRDTSTHILLYGPQGTGKTSFAHGVAEQLGIPSYEIVRGEENITKNRRAAILACLNMTNNDQGSLILVDEADNLLNTRFSWFMRGETQDKGWLNQLLEEPGVRMIWITNRIDDIEKSVLRRFAFSLHFKPFSRRQRIQLWNSILKRNKAKRFLSETEIVELAKRYKVSAGAIDIAVKKIVEACPASKDEFYRAITLALDSHEMLMNGGEKQIFKDMIEKNYSLDGMNIKGDPRLLLHQVEKFDHYLRHSDTDNRMNMNLLFYGPPGTGKSEFARYLGDHLNREIICKRVSDIQSMWVGESEKNIRDAFEEAEREEAILIIDEVDSLLFKRGKAMRSWEISFTNEFLTQMERFKGILICTTNRLRDLDEASIRRFQHKIGFDYLKPDGNVIFYQNFLAPLTNTPLDKATEEALKKMTNLAPGDFKVVRDKNSFRLPEELDHQVLVKTLKEEAQIKKLHQGDKDIGF